jgi:hypothetical protein
MKRSTLFPTIYLLFSVVFFSFLNETQGIFKKDGVSFTIPDNWKVSNKQKLEGNGYSITLENKKELSVGVIFTSWFEADMELTSFSDLFKEQFKTQEAMEGIEFSENRKSKFSGVESLNNDFKVTVNSMPLKGEFICFKKKGKMFFIMLQTTVAEDKSNNSAIKTFSNSFKVK